MQTFQRYEGPEHLRGRASKDDRSKGSQAEIKLRHPATLRYIIHFKMKTIAGNYLIIICLLLIIAKPFKLSAQIGESAPGMAPVMPVPGYVLFGNGDTLFGMVKWSLKYVENNPVEIKFTARDGSTKIYTASDIRGFGNNLIGINENYISLPSMKKGIPVFLNRLMGGRITVYMNRSSMGISSSTTVERSRIDGIGFYFVPGEGLSIGPTYHTDIKVINARSRYSSYFVSKDFGPLIKIDKDNYETQVESLFGDCKDVADELAKNPDLGKFKNFMILAEVYNRLCGFK
jgi:hypothetical protein